MNILRYVGSRGYRDRFSEEYSKEFIGRFDLPEREYDKLYYRSDNQDNIGRK